MNLDRHIALAERYPHDFTLQYPPRREYFMDCFRVAPNPDLVEQRLRKAGELLLYAHVPFCAAKCFYCNFAVDTRVSRGRQERYVDGLCLQLSALNEQLDSGVLIAGIDIGGGTPTLLDSELLEKLVRALVPWSRRSRSAFPMSIETTPAIAAAEVGKLSVLVAQGVQRVSVGVQSTNAQTLNSVNRGHQVAQTERALANLTKVGFRRVNADLIFGLPGQTRPQFRADLEQLISSGVDSITTYDCLYRGKGRALTRRTAHLTDNQEYRSFYDMAFELLTGNGFHAHYGSVNFSRHPAETGTSPYFEGRLLDGLPYLGLGNYASSLLGGYWWFAPYSVDQWVRRVSAGDSFPVGDIYALPLAERIAKHLLLSLSFGRIDPRRFAAAHGCTLVDACGPAINRALEEGWLAWGADCELHMTPGSFGCLPKLRSLFYTEQAIAWLEHHQTGG